MTKSLHFIPEKCTGCHQCELACSGINEGVFTVERSRIRIYQVEVGEGTKNIPHACHQCDEAWCLYACPVEAITLLSDIGAKLVDGGLCVGCKVCTIACPYGTISYQPDTGKVAKCDMCQGEDPACVDSCPTGAIEVSERIGGEPGMIQATA